jgi:hypothetical protein
MTDMIPADEQVLKTDTKGRVQTPAARRESLLDEFEHSGLSGKKFAALVGVKYQTFASWGQKRRRQRGGGGSVPAKAADPVRWLEAVVQQARGPAKSERAGLKLQLPGGAWMEIADASQIAFAAALLHALEKPLA